MYRTHQGCILHFHPSMRRSIRIQSCDVSWISPFKHEREILFARSMIYPSFDEKIHKEQYGWNAKVESEDEYTQMILLTWVEYDQYIQQTMQISAMWNHQIDLNLIYVTSCCCEKDVNLTAHILTVFEQWKLQNNNEQKYKARINKFLKKRCCNHSINLFCIFLCQADNEKKVIEAASEAVNNGLPFVEKDKAQKQ
ncbi:hypothetical protein RFI_39288 [Reticulomyxa filosa]|uniref:Uncharacterized protein n=1 Tax=Reticulomyxa filosa TaxID=46433 RepID=X6L8C5_RETFI|nr:hypothetical protein RFI_39288 [Reticulomyxa filosa]|eukprot:ETN98222.1 hypothetical protein RFI_39288 [Reticulomyxa filosa]